MDAVERILIIGETDLCSEKELYLFLPDYPVLRGSENIFDVPQYLFDKLSDNEVNIFIRGLHKIEEGYKKFTKSSFGFGSPSQTYKLLLNYAERNYNSAVKLEEWIAANGGNYYIQEISEAGNFKSRLRTKAQLMTLNANLENQKQYDKQLKQEERKLIVQPKLDAHAAKVEQERYRRQFLHRLSPKDLLNSILASDYHIYFYEKEILNLNKSQLAPDCQPLIKQLIAKIPKPSTPTSRRITKHLVSIST